MDKLYYECFRDRIKSYWEGKTLNEVNAGRLLNELTVLAKTYDKLNEIKENKHNG